MGTSVQVAPRIPLTTSGPHRNLTRRRCPEPAHEKHEHSVPAPVATNFLLRLLLEMEVLSWMRRLRTTEDEVEGALCEAMISRVAGASVTRAGVVMVFVVT